MKNIRTDTPQHAPDGLERDACAIYMSVRKQGQSTFGTLKRSLGALMHMGHRTGFVNGEGDGAGVQTDIPRRLWGKKLSQAGLPSYLATNPGFWVGHLFIPQDVVNEALVGEITSLLHAAELNPLLNQPGRVRKEVLGQNARLNPPSFWQIIGYSPSTDLDQRLLQAQIELEANYPIHFSSLSSHTVVYKVRGSVETLVRYYPDLQDHNYDTAMVLCHARYSTNTVSTFERSQPFAILGHNGEINTINRLRVEGRQIGATLPRDGSDSQDLDRVLHTLCANYNLSLVEAMEMVFPPSPYEVEMFPPDLAAAYRRLQHAFGPYAQGPAAIVARYGNSIVASVDALGLRPLWYVETEKEFVFSSERGAIPLEVMITDPRPMAPGEKIAIHFHRGEIPEAWDHRDIRSYVMTQAFQREAPQLASRYWLSWAGAERTQPQANRPGNGWQTLKPNLDAPYPAGRTAGRTATAEPPVAPQVASLSSAVPVPQAPARPLPWLLASARQVDIPVIVASGWLQEHLREVNSLISTNKDDLISSLGYDGPLAVLSKSRVNLADFFKEAVAVVTNPSIDHAREQEVFSTTSLVGTAPAIGKAHNPEDRLVVLDLPVLLGGYKDQGQQAYVQAIAQKFGTLTLEELLQTFENSSPEIANSSGWLHLALATQPGESVHQALLRLAGQVVEAVQAGVQCVLLDDGPALEQGLGWLDPLLVVSMLDEALRQAPVGDQGNLRRRVGLVLRSAAIRNLHDLALAFGFGVDAVNPYALIDLALNEKEENPESAEVLLNRLMSSLHDGLEKVISTMGCHELRGYGRACGAIGLAPSVAEVLQAPNYFGSETAGLNWQRLDEDSRQRAAELRGDVAGLRPGHVGRFNPRIWKAIATFAKGQSGFDKVRQTYQRLMEEMPVALRHVIGVRHISDVISPYDVDISIGDHSLPMVIDAMSFGSQGETSYKSYAQAAANLNIICINGEGGELPDIMGIYKKNRGQQVASGRFGVNVEFLNSAAVLEIKIGQGAKPGEGGMLPAHKVTEQVALARRTPVNVALHSPSNNHDLYSIEDLAQLIEELHMVNPQARISVKVPVVPGIGVIAVGIAKAGADIINISGYDGGTGAARKHSLQYVGLPTEIGIIQAHRALLAGGLRHRVELWANGGMKTGEDVVKMILLGANRVGFATVAMVAIGCTICRDCNLGTCHVGIATQVKTEAEAATKGLKHFCELHYEESVIQLVRTFKGIGEEIRTLTACLGVSRLQDLVGRADLLEQVARHDQVDLSAMFEPAPIEALPDSEPGVGRLLIRPRNSLTTILTDLIIQTIAENEREVTYQDTVTAIDRALGSRLAGELTRRPDLMEKIDTLHLRFGPSSLAGNGFAAWTTDQIDILIEGGAQDGAAKGASGGRVAVMKGINHDGLRIDGSVGKSFAYGAQGGVLIVQGNADSRACVRLSGASVLFGGQITTPIDDTHWQVGLHANLKGFACEYMTSGTVVILGDPGPYAFSGMTGGIVYQFLTPEMGFDLASLKRRIARGASVQIEPLSPNDLPALQRMLDHYSEALEQTYQIETAEQIRCLAQPELLLERCLKVTAR
jgi:glutamate synthase (NADPH/NADH) large chain